MDDDITTALIPTENITVLRDEKDLEVALIQEIYSLGNKDMLIVALISGGFNRIESSSIVGITRNAVGKRYTKAILALRKRLEEGGYWQYTDV